MTPKTARHVLKAAEVTLEDPVQLSIDPSATTGCSPARSAPAGPVARIAQSCPEYAVIEVTCVCGRTVQVRCDYVAGSSSGAGPGPTQP